VAEGLPNPYDTARVKILYPASEDTGYFTTAKETDSPFPVVVFIGGAFIESNRYQWLGERLVEDHDVVFVTFDILGTFNDLPSIVTDAFSAVDLESASPVLTIVFETLRKFNDEGILAGKLDLDRVVLGGHSAGGSMALMNGDDELFPGIVGVFTYASHLAAGPFLGFPPASFIPLTSTVPALLMSGNRDGVIPSFGFRYGVEWETPTEPIERTFHEAFPEEKPGYYIEFDGFNHLAMVDPIDTTVGSGFNDSKSDVGKDVMKNRLTAVISLFIREHMFEDEDASAELRRMVNRPPSFVSNAIFKS